MNSFLNGKKSLAIAPLHRHGTALSARPAAKPGAASSATAPAAHANVEVVKEGDKVVRLIVTCVCGERIEVECLYPAGS